MSKGKTILISALCGITCLTAGAWLGKSYSDRKHDENFTLTEFLSVQHHVTVLGYLYNNDQDKAIKELERRLNVEILVLGQNPYHPRVLNDNERSALQLAAEHRGKHPFTINSPGINKMVKDALQSSN